MRLPRRLEVTIPGRNSYLQPSCSARPRGASISPPMTREDSRVCCNNVLYEGVVQPFSNNQPLSPALVPFLTGHSSQVTDLIQSISHFSQVSSRHCANHFSIFRIRTAYILYYTSHRSCRQEPRVSAHGSRSRKFQFSTRVYGAKIWHLV